MSAFAYRNLKGCSSAVQAHRYEGLVHVVLEFASMAWDPHQQRLKSTLELVQRRTARRVLHDFSPTSNASALVAQVQQENLQSRRTSDKVCTTYKIMNGLVDVNPAAGLFEPRNRRSRWQNTSSKSPTPEQTRTCIR